MKDFKQYLEEAEQLHEKAVSKAQQRFMGMVHAAQKGEKPASKEVSKVAKDMGKKDAKDFAKTKHKGLPAHVKEGHQLPGKDEHYALRNNIWTLYDGDEIVHEYRPERGEIVGAKKLLARFDDEGYDVTHVVSPMGVATYLYGKPEDEIDEAGTLDRYRDHLGTTGNLQRQNDRHQSYQDASHDTRLNHERNRQRRDDAQTQADIDRMSNRNNGDHNSLSKWERDDWDKTFDVMRDRLNRYQWSSQRDVDPEQLKKISDIKYTPRQKNEESVPNEKLNPGKPSGVQKKTDDVLAYQAYLKAKKEKEAVKEGKGIMLNGKEVDMTSLEVDGVDPRDYPDFADAYFSAGYFTDGTEMSDEELDQFQNENGDLLYDKAYDRLHEADMNLIKDRAGVNKSEVPAYKRKNSGDSDWKVSQDDLKKEREKSATSPEGLAALKKRMGMIEDGDQ